MGIISKTLDWLAHPWNDDDTDTLDWFAFALLAIIAGYLWHKIPKGLVAD